MPSTGKVYIEMPNEDNPASHVVETKARDYAFDLSNRSYITVQNISIVACTINTSASSSNILLDHLTASYVSHSIGITQDNQDPWKPSDHPHTTGIILNGTLNTLQNSVIAYSSGDGCFSEAHTIPYKTASFMMSPTKAATKRASRPSARTNRFYTTPFTMWAGLVWLSNTTASLISHNLIYSIGLQMTDLGGIYTWGTNGQWTQISYNVVHGVHSAGYGAAGIYLDNTSQEYIVSHNVAYDCDFALKLGPPTWNDLIINNTLIGTKYSLEASGNEDMTASVLENNIFSGTAMFGPGSSHPNNLLTQPIRSSPIPGRMITSCVQPRRPSMPGKCTPPTRMVTSARRPISALTSMAQRHSFPVLQPPLRPHRPIRPLSPTSIRKRPTPSGERPTAAAGSYSATNGLGSNSKMLTSAPASPTCWPILHRSRRPHCAFNFAWATSLPRPVRRWCCQPPRTFLHGGQNPQCRHLIIEGRADHHPMLIDPPAGATADPFQLFVSWRRTNRSSICPRIPRL